MRPAPIPTAIAAALVLAGCSAGFDVGNLNPFTSAEEEAAAEAEAAAAAAANRPGEPPTERIAAVEAVTAGRGYRGVLVQADGLAPRPGYFRAQLRLLNEGRPAADGRVELEFVARAPETAANPPDPAAQAPAPSDVARRVTAAQFVGDDLLAAATGIRVLATGNAAEIAVPR